MGRAEIKSPLGHCGLVMSAARSDPLLVIHGLITSLCCTEQRMPIRCNSESNLLEAVAEERAINKMTHRSQDDTQVSGRHYAASGRTHRVHRDTRSTVAHCL
ncbi:hypothetical protein HPB48_013103 [Haemaphysalis longicornis]|uniref:Uncharacterized protein n=1 Tax=Haemaphysalis longicornis TaxID=44386 RepID=A0A9J6G4K5_HAELO|nr:hypothetical protein HPB48_013103 [Haemaphysalis longicornis]